MKPLAAFLAVAAALSVATLPAAADWDTNDPYKMHYPQLPDPLGWDVQSQNYPLADDWGCTESGPVTDIHLWFSMIHGIEPFVMNSVYITIYGDDPADPNEPTDYSRPGALLWGGRFFDPNSFTVRLAGTGDEGWYDPVDPNVGFILHDHFTYYQLNLTEITDPFIQEKGNIYWLSVSYGATSYAGWKTSQNHWNDDAVYWHWQDGWRELIDPLTGDSLDLAFVITPEPGTMALLALGGLALIRRRRAS